VSGRRYINMGDEHENRLQFTLRLFIVGQVFRLQTSTAHLYRATADLQHIA